MPVPSRCRASTGLWQQPLLSRNPGQLALALPHIPRQTFTSALSVVPMTTAAWKRLPRHQGPDPVRAARTAMMPGACFAG